MSNHWPEATEGRIPTHNKMGFMFLEINGASPAFLQNIPQCTDKILDLGCAYGIVTLPALQQAQCQVIAFDLSKEHLDILNAAVSKDNAKKLTTVHGRFPDDFNFADNSLDAIHSSYMFHFLNGVDTQNGLQKCFQALKSGGKIYVNTVAVYFRPFKGVLPIYEENSARGAKWPGEIFNLKEHSAEQDIPYVPDFIHAHKVEDSPRLLQNTGFPVDKIFYYDLQEPVWFASAGKGLIGAIATKPCHG
ncbi:hypothetical protein BH10PSE19_BH10PSE19_17820 [soil metagenome]